MNQNVRYCDPIDAVVSILCYALSTIAVTVAAAAAARNASGDMLFRQSGRNEMTLKLTHLPVICARTIRARIAHISHAHELISDGGGGSVPSLACTFA